MSTHNDEFKSIFGRRLQAARKKEGLNQLDFANLVGIARDTLSRYERGEIVPSAEVLSSIVRSLSDINLTSDWLLFGDPSVLERPEPVVLENFGSLIGFGFDGKGTARVSMGFPEITRVIKGCIEFEERNKKPNNKVINYLQQLIEHYYEDGADIEMIANVVIAVHGVRLVPEFPDVISKKEKSDTENRRIRKNINDEDHDYDEE